MRTVSRLVAIAAIAGALTGCGGTTTASAPPRLGQGSLVEFGYIDGIAKTRNGYLLRFQLALWLAGPTGLQACIADGACGADTKALPDDRYVRDLHSVLVFRLPSEAPVEVVSSGSGLPSIPITPRQLFAAERHHGAMPGVLSTTGLPFWVETTPAGTVIRLEQQYSP